MSTTSSFGLTDNVSLRLPFSCHKCSSVYGKSFDFRGRVSLQKAAQQVEEGVTVLPPERNIFINYAPKTKTLDRSMVFFARYLLQHIKEKRLKKSLSQSKMRLFSKSRRSSSESLKDDKDAELLSQLKEEVDREHNERKSLPETISSLNTIRKEMIELVGYDASLLIPCFGCASVAALMSTAVPHFYGLCVTCLANASITTRKEVLTALSGLLGFSVLEAVFAGFRGGLFWVAGSRANYNVRVKLHRNLLLQEASFFDSTETGTLLSRLNNDANKIGMVISFHVNVIFRQFTQLVFGAIYLLMISRRLAFVAFTGIVLVAFVSTVYGQFTRRLAEKVQDTFAAATAVAETSFSMSETVRAFDGVNSETTKYEASQYRALELEEVQAWAYGSHKIVSEILEAGLQGFLLFTCWSVGKAGGLPAAKLTTFMFYVNFVLQSTNEVGDQWAKIQSAVGASKNVFNLIQRTPSIRDSVKDIALAENSTLISFDESAPLIQFSDMSVTYGAMKAPALSNINLNINPGDRVAIVGRSGSGKSSLLRSVIRFYDPSSGTCKVEGRNLIDLTRKEIASKIALVEQEPHLFPMSLIDNVLYGVSKDVFDNDTREANYGAKWRDDVAEALELAGLSVSETQQNNLGLELDTRVGEGGRTLSGGQRQRVAIARALIRKPDVLLLDEPTAALDSESEKIVVEALVNAMQKTKSMLMVTHRLGVVRSLGVNKVVVLERGKIVEMGEPEKLLRIDGLYAQLAKEQGITMREPELDSYFNNTLDHDNPHNLLVN